MVYGHSRKDIPCEIPGICTLVHVNNNLLDEEPFHSVYQVIYSTSIVANYLDTSTVKTGIKFYKKNLPSGIIFTKADAYISYEHVEKLTMEFNVHYRASIGSLIYLLSTIVYLNFLVHKLAKFS